jgi:hypothetical protein
MLICVDTHIRVLSDEYPNNLNSILFQDNTYLPNSVQGEHMNVYIQRVKKRQLFSSGLPSELLTNVIFSKRRSITRCKAIKGDLMEQTWHPDRILTWCGVNFETDNWY